MFHEIDQDKIDRVRGMDITFVTSATTDDEGLALLRAAGLPVQGCRRTTRRRPPPVKSRLHWLQEPDQEADVEEG
jgi:hypothetical protein